MAITRTSRYFKDISLAFDAHPITKDLPVLQNEAAIIRSIRNLVETIPTERFFNSTLGSDVRSSLFEFVDYATASTIEDQIRIIILNYEPRVQNVDVNVIHPQIQMNLKLPLVLRLLDNKFPFNSFHLY